jgi:hypothetical protein
MPVIADRYWILKKDNRKVGQIEAQDDGYTVKISNTVTKYKTIKMLDRDIEFVPAVESTPNPENQVYGYDTGQRVFNPMWDIQQRLPLFTQEENSKSWFAAGWYYVKKHRVWKMTQNPKLITLQRYSYQGPYHTKEEAVTKGKP